MKKLKTTLIIHTQQWFYNRIGKRIFRDGFKCCKSCDEVAKNGLIVHDRQHAHYLYLCQNEMGAEGRHLNYRAKI